MKIVITGGEGMLGRTLQRELSSYEVTSADLPSWDITNAGEFEKRLCETSPDVVIHCAAFTNVDDCESNSEAAYRLNETGSANVARACGKCGARLIAISTDYVFSGDLEEGKDGWSEQDVPRPKTVYGMSKFAGEQAILSRCPDALILRIAWLYGRFGHNFVYTMMRLGSLEGEPVRVVNDQKGNPTSTMAVARLIKFLLGKPSVSGIVHATCEGVATWHEFACEIKRLSPAFKRSVVPCTTEEFPRPAPRPKNSSLKKDVLDSLGYKMPFWKDALSEFFAEEPGE